MPDTRYIDNTILSAWKKCHLSAYLTYAQGYDRQAPRTPGSPPRLVNIKQQFGIAFHQCAATWLETRDVLASAQAFHETYAPALTITPDDDRYRDTNTRDLVGAWLYAQSTLPATFTPAQTWIEKHLEVPFYEDSDGLVVFVSRPDAMGLMAGYPGVYGRETKTTGNRLGGGSGNDWSTQWEKSSQITSQLWAIGRTTGQPPAGILVDALEVSRLPISTKKCATHGTPYSDCRLSHAVFRQFGPYVRSQAALDNWYKLAVTAAQEYYAWKAAYPALADGVANVPDDGQFDAGGACRFCDWREWDASGKDPNLIAANAIIAPWNPRTGRRERATT